MCELSISVMNVIAGFIPHKNDNYHVPRSTIGMPGSLTPDQVAAILFPNLVLWRNECNSPDGDKSKSTREFLYKVIVYLSEVIVQDGLMWVRNHEGNPAVVELQTKMDGRTGVENYNSWTQRKYSEIKHEIEIMRMSKKRKENDLNQKLAASISRMESLNDQLERELELLVSYYQ